MMAGNRAEDKFPEDSTRTARVSVRSNPIHWFFAGRPHECGHYELNGLGVHCALKMTMMASMAGEVLAQISNATGRPLRRAISICTACLLSVVIGPHPADAQAVQPSPESGLLNSEPTALAAGPAPSAEPNCKAWG